MRNRPTGRTGNILVVYEFENGPPWQVFQVINGFVTHSERTNDKWEIPADGNIAVCAELSWEGEAKVYDRVAKARLTTIDGLLKFLREHLEDVGT